MDEAFLHKKLGERKEQDAFRELRLPAAGMIDLCSNDYLGVVKNKLLPVAGDSAAHLYGSTGSRLLTGNHSIHEETEQLIAGFHGVEAALLFNSGYDANLGLLSSVPQRGDLIFYDQYVHASIRDGIRLSFAEAFPFRHNDLQDLEDKLKKATGTGTIFIVTESVFSMDGDYCPLKELVAISHRFNARLVVDEAHATGVVGDRGEGLVQHLQLEEAVFARIHTFGKACGVHGAAVLGSSTLRNYLVNFARSFIYSTALSQQAVSHIRSSYDLFPRLHAEREQLQKLVRHFQSAGKGIVRPGSAPIQAILVPGNKEVKQAADRLQQRGLDVRPILYPTVPRGGERLRIVLHSFNSETELDLLLNSLKNSW
jgi:8-amino-7-oxononanoate synthase